MLELDLDVSMTPDAAAKRAEEVLAHEGAFIRTEPGGQDAPVEVIGLIAVGFGNLNPAVVTVTIRPSEVLARGWWSAVRPESLIKQRAGEAAAERIANSLADVGIRVEPRRAMFRV